MEHTIFPSVTETAISLAAFPNVDFMILTPVMQFNAVTSSTANISFEVVDDDVFEKFTVSANPSANPYHGVRISVKFQSIVCLLVQSFYHKKRVNLGLIAREGFSNVSYIKKCALQHTKSLKESD